MMPETIAATAVSLAATAIGFLVAYVLFRDLWVDEVRDQLFDARDKLFLYALDDGLVDNPAHRLLREHANRLIRYAHEISFFRYMVVITVRVRFNNMEPTGNFVTWKNAVDNLPSHQAE